MNCATANTEKTLQDVDSSHVMGSDGHQLFLEPLPVLELSPTTSRFLKEIDVAGVGGYIDIVAKNGLATLGKDIALLGSTHHQIPVYNPGSLNNFVSNSIEKLRNKNAKNAAALPPPEDDVSCSGSSNSYTQPQLDRWQERFNELARFKGEYGHCCVPSHWPQHDSLSQWVKRQRYQRRLKKEGKHSNLTEKREKALNNLGFVWECHAVFWEERLNELKGFVQEKGHANVPTKYPENQQLAVWCTRQRRHFKLFMHGDKRSVMTLERINKLMDVGFVFDPRKAKGNRARTARS